MPNHRTGVEIALHGSYYGHNFGDELLLSLYARWIREAQDRAIVVAPFASEEMGRTIGADRRGPSALARARLLIYGGGGYFGEQPHRPIKWGYRNLLRHVPPAFVMEVRQKPYAVIGVGVGPLSNPVMRKAATRLFKRAAVVAVRDIDSRRYLAEYGVVRSEVIVTADAVLTIHKPSIGLGTAAEKVSDPSRPGPIPRMGLHLAVPGSMRHLAKPALQTLERFIGAHPELKLVLFSDSRPQGRNASEQQPSAEAQYILEKYVERAAFVPYHDPWMLLDLIKSLDIVVTTKLHVGIAAVAVGTAVLAIPYHPKVRRFYKQLGAEEWCIPLYTLNPKVLATRLRLVYNAGRPTPIVLPDQLVKDAWENKRLITKMVHEYS